MSQGEPSLLHFVAARGDEAEEALFRFEIRLQAIERFFNPANQPERSRVCDPPRESFRDEFLIVQRQLGLALRTTTGLLSEAESGALVFQSYVENHWVSDEARDLLLQRHSAQATPTDSLFLLHVGLLSLLSIAAGLRGSAEPNRLTFDALGRQYRSLLAANRYFNPFRTRRFTLIAPAGHRSLVRRAVQAVTSPRLRRAMLLVAAIIERLLGTLAMVNERAKRREELLDALPFFAFLRSEFRVLQSFLEEGFLTRWLPADRDDPSEEEFRSRIDALAFELRTDVRRVFTEFLLDFISTHRARSMRGALQAAHGLLTVFFEHAFVAILSFGAPGLTVRQVFPDAEIRFHQSRRLREDLWLFGEVLRHVIDQILSTELEPGHKRRAYRGLLEFLAYFEYLGFQFVRENDREAFEHFFKEMRQLGSESFADLLRCSDVAANFECFRIYIQTVLAQVSNRADLQAVPFDGVRARLALKQFTRALAS